MLPASGSFATKAQGKASSRLESQSLDLQVDFKVFYRKRYEQLTRMNGLLIGDVAEQSGVSTPTIRYYESIGLLKAAPRSSSGYRRYSERTVNELRFIRKAQALGFALDEVAEILKLSRSGQEPCAHVLSLTQHHLSAVDQRIKQLQGFRAYLATELGRWEKQKTATTCDGLCQFIAGAEPTSPPAPEPLDSPAAAPRKRTRRTKR